MVQLFTFEKFLWPSIRTSKSNYQYAYRMARYLACVREKRYTNNRDLIVSVT